MCRSPVKSTRAYILRKLSTLHLETRNCQQFLRNSTACLALQIAWMCKKRQTCLTLRYFVQCLKDNTANGEVATAIKQFDIDFTLSNWRVQNYLRWPQVKINLWMQAKFSAGNDCFLFPQSFYCVCQR